MQWLASQDVTYGTRVLALAVPDDLIVTANRAAMPREINRVVPPEGMEVDDAPRAGPESLFISELFEQTRRVNRGPFGWVEVSADVGPEAVRAARAHFRIMDSDYARALAHGFLSDRRDPCPTGWDEWGPGAGMIVDAAEGYIGWAYGQMESFIARRLRVGTPYEGARIGDRITRNRRRE
jgi:hypothetical protein